MGGRGDDDGCGRERSDGGEGGKWMVMRWMLAREPAARGRNKEMDGKRGWLAGAGTRSKIK